MHSMKYRLLEPNEWHKLSVLLDSTYVPLPETASAAVAEDENGNILGVLFLQLAMHMEPLVLSSPHVSFERLHNVLFSAIKNDKGLRIYCFSDQEIVNRMAIHVGMEKLPYTVFSQEVL